VGAIAVESTELVPVASPSVVSMGSYDDELGAHLRRLGCNNERIARELERQREERLLYSDANGDPVLKESYVAYLDALGTRARVGALDDLGLRQELLLRRYRWFLHDEEWQKGYQRFLAFTDNVVIGTPVTTDTYGEPAFVPWSTSRLCRCIPDERHCPRHGPTWRRGTRSSLHRRWVRNWFRARGRGHARTRDRRLPSHNSEPVVHGDGDGAS